ncbi:MAG: inactive transglutaminase family protein [Gammaproteobacteria bacterium]|nr:inactive transglutaminase family protein [Gammaproteobacteria bacterium]
MHRTPVIFWSVLFVVIGLAIFLHKSIQLDFPLSADKETEAWTVQARLSFEANKRNVKAMLYIPHVTPGYSKLEEYYISGNFGLNAKKSDDNKTANWAIRKAEGEQTLYYRTTVTKTGATKKWNTVPDYPDAPQFEEPYATAISKIIEDVRSQSADTYSFTYELINQLKSSDANENISLIRGLADSNHEIADLVIKLLSVAHIPTRKVWVIGLADAVNNTHPRVLIQAYNGDEWLTFNPKDGNAGIPTNHLVWKVGDGPFYEVKNAKDVELQFSVTKSYIELLDVAKQNAKRSSSMLGGLTLFALPVQSQNTYSLLLMVPLGALLVVFMRTFIGVQTFGTFMPILIAIAFRETQLFWGIVLFTGIVFVGLLIRFYLEHLRLLLIPRLAVILVTVVTLMLIISLITSRLGVDRLLSISLFPMVILAMTIERMSITWEENGAQAALFQGLGSLVVASFGYLLMTSDRLSYLMFVFPELLLVILGICLIMGRYTGYRLNELLRFREMKSIKNNQS